MASEPTVDEFLNPANWMGAKEFSALIGVTQQSLYNMVDRCANLPPVHRRAGSTRLRFYKPEIYEWMRQSTTFPTAPRALRPGETACA